MQTGGFKGAARGRLRREGGGAGGLGPAVGAPHVFRDISLVSEENSVFTFLFLPQKYPPYISSSIPFLGHAIAFGKSPIEFLENAYDKVRFLTRMAERVLKYFCVSIKLCLKTAESLLLP